MAKAKMQYVAFFDEGDQSVMHVASVGESEYRFLVVEAIPALKPLSIEEYMHGPAVILQTFAKYSYILFKGDLFWCIEWPPGLLIVRINANGELDWAAFRSPNPRFGGRKATKEELANFDWDADNPLHKIVFDAWDAEIEKDVDYFEPATRHWCNQYETAIEHLNTHGEAMAARFGDTVDQWRETCKKNIKEFAGPGITLRG